MTERTAGEMAAELSLLLHQKLGVRGGGLEAKIARAGRDLPARIRRRAREIAEAEAREASPRLARQNDYPALQKAFSDVERHLNGINVVERRWHAALGMMASVGFVVAVVFGALVAWLAWRGAL